MKKNQTKTQAENQDHQKGTSAENPMNRRNFIGGVTSASVGISIVPSYVLGGSKHVAPSDKINVAYIGLGTQGLRELPDLLKLPDVHISAVCGKAMAPLAGLLTKKGYKVTGSDTECFPPMSNVLEKLGVETLAFDEKNVDEADVLAVGNVFCGELTVPPGFSCSISPD